MHLSTHKAKGRLAARDITVFAMLSTILFLSRFGLQWLPGVHPMAMIIAAMTLVYRVRALIPLYSYILLDGVLHGFSMWWMPYLYIWLTLWAAFMLLGRLKLNRKVQVPLYMFVCALHGLSFGLMYAPAQALMFGFNFQTTIAWIMAGLPFDIVHAIANFVVASMIIPLSTLLKNLESGHYRT